MASGDGDGDVDGDGDGELLIRRTNNWGHLQRHLFELIRASDHALRAHDIRDLGLTY